MLLQKSKQEWLNSQPSSIFYSEFWPRRLGGKHLAITNHGSTALLNWSLSTLYSAECSTSSCRNLGYLKLQRELKSLPCKPKSTKRTELHRRPWCKIISKREFKTLIALPLFFLWFLSEVKTVPSFCTWIMKGLQILWDFLRLLPDEISLQPSSHQILVPEIKKFNSSNKETNLGEQDFLWFWGGETKYVISHSSCAKKQFYFFGILPFSCFTMLLGKANTEYPQSWELQEVRGKILCCIHNKLSN